MGLNRWTSLINPASWSSLWCGLRALLLGFGPLANGIFDPSLHRRLQMEWGIFEQEGAEIAEGNTDFRSGGFNRRRS
jgi:hypothetical protein